jgi:hypothetical protein
VQVHVLNASIDTHKHAVKRRGLMVINFTHVIHVFHHYGQHYNIAPDFVDFFINFEISIP